MKKRSEATQTLHTGCSKADPQTNTQTNKTDRGDYNTLHSLAHNVIMFQWPYLLFLSCFQCSLYQILLVSSSILDIRSKKGTRNSAVADKRRNALVQTQCCGWPPKNMPLPMCVTKPNLVVLRCSHKYRSRPKLVSTGTLLSWNGRLGWRQNTRPSPTCVTTTTW